MTLLEMICKTPIQRPCAFPMSFEFAVVCQRRTLDKIPPALLKRAKQIFVYGRQDNLPQSIHNGIQKIPVTHVTRVQQPMFDSIVFFHDTYEYAVLSSTDYIISKYFFTHSFYVYMPVLYNDGFTTTHLPGYFSSNQKELEEIFALLEDDESKLVFASRIRALETGSIDFVRVSTFPMYFHPCVQPEEGDVVLDGGISENCTAQQEILQKISPTGKLIGFEPDPLGMDKASKFLEKECPWGQYALVPKGLWRRNDTLYFRLNGQGTQIVNNATKGTLECPVTSIDAFCRANHLDRVDFIKLDIEGAEKEALLGAVATIAQHKPKLAVSLYHKHEDLYLLPKLIDSICSDYRYYLGHHHPSLHETVLYCSPRV